MVSAELDVLVVNYNTATLLQPMFNALRQSNNADRTRYLVVDNASADNSLECLANVCPEALQVANDSNVGFGRANNQLVEHLQGKYALLLNTDAFVAADTLNKTLEYMEAHPDCGILRSPGGPGRGFATLLPLFSNAIECLHGAYGA